jgi:hypothetical protein
MAKKQSKDMEEIKKEYEILKNKYSLPEFEKLAEDFDVEKIVEKATSFILRDVRRAIGERISVYLHFFETLINPAAPPMFIFSILKNLEERDREKIREVYRKLANLQISAMKLDTFYKEKDEAEFIKKANEKWGDIKKKTHELLDDFEKKFKADSESIKKDYFG